MVLRLKGSDGVPPSRVGGRRAFAPGPSPALARRKTPHFAGPRPQSAARSEVVCLLRLLLARAFGGELSALPPPALRTGQRRRLPLALLTTDLLPCPALRAGSLCSKVSRVAACVNTTAPVDCQASLSVHFRSTLRSFGRFVPLITAGLFASFLKLSKRPSATKAK